MKLATSSWVLAIGAALLAALAAALVMGAGQQPQWLPPSQARALPVPAKPAASATIPAQSLALTWQQSMFSPDRKADTTTAKGGATSLAGIRLSGVVIEGQARWALLRLANDRRISLAVGSQLDNGWTLSALTPQQATFTHQGQSESLSLPVLRLPPPSKAPAITLPHVTTP